MSESKKFKIAGSVFSVTLDAPWSFMQYTAPVLERIKSAREGKPVQGSSTISDDQAIKPVRAGDEVPTRTYVRSREELPSPRIPGAMDFSQYEPFAYEGPDEVLFDLEVTAHSDAGIPSDASLAMKVDDFLPAYDIYEKDGALLFEFFPQIGVSAGVLTVSPGLDKGIFAPRPGMKAYGTLWQINIASMLMFTLASASRGTLLMHSSVVRKNGFANLFLGKSGTGKSTHARLWIENIPGCDLLNDDNPALRIITDESQLEGCCHDRELAAKVIGKEGAVYVFGTPWSGKTPCYRNVTAPVGAIVRLQQAPKNYINRLPGLEAFASVISSASLLRWKSEFMDKAVPVAEKTAMTVKCLSMHCLPDPAAAEVCCDAINQTT